MGPQTCRVGLRPKVQNREPVWVLYSQLNPHNARALQREYISWQGEPVYDIKYSYISLQREYLSVKIYIYV